MKAIKNKLSKDGTPRNHSAPMSKEYMDRIHAWSKSSCHLDLAIQYVQRAMASGSVKLPPGEQLPSLEVRTAITRHLGQIAFFATAWTIWTR